MPKRSEYSRLLDAFLRLLRKAFLRAILFLIFIGDTVRAALKFPFSLISYSISTTARFLKNIRLPRMPQLSLPRIPRLPALPRLPSLSQVKFNIKVPRIKGIHFHLPIPVCARYFIAGVIVTCIVLTVYQANQFVHSLPNPRLIGAINYPVSSKLYDRNGALLYEVYRDQNRTPIPLRDIPDVVKKATIAVEDKDFYKHRGISLFGGILRAVKEMILTHKVQGGSTITQQLVKTSLLTPERTLQRKLKEAVLAVWVERVYSKDQILEMYFNQVSYGGASYGIEEAAQAYFGKHARELDLVEAAFLAGLPQAPSYYSPHTNPRLSEKRRNEVLKRMREEKYINDQTYAEALQKPLLVKEPREVIRAPHFVFYVKSLLERKYGTRRIEEGGLRIYTSLDMNIQQNAQDILNDELDKIQRLHVTNGALLVTIPSTGEILSMVGSRDYFAAPFGAFNVTTAPRQPGSAIKPLMYSLALERGYTAATVIDDNPVIFKLPGSKPFKPVNYDGKFHGRVTLRQALANSYNIPAVRVLNSLGVVEFINHATAMGIGTWYDPSRYGLSLTLGGGEVMMTDLSTAFGVFANEGVRVDLNPILKIEDYRGNVIYDKQSDSPKKTSVISKYTAFIISSILSDSQTRQAAFGSNSRLDIPGFTVAVKTGTTNDKRDNWTVGYTPQLLTAVWVGNNDNTPMNQALTSGVTGAAPIWNRVMSFALKSPIKSKLDKDVPAIFVEPMGIIKKPCFFGRVEYFVAGTTSKINCNEALTTPTPTP